MAKGTAKGKDLSDVSPKQDFLCFPVGFGKPLILADHQNPVMFLCCLHHILTLLQGNCHRLFTQHMLPCLQRLNGDGCMDMIGRAYAHSLDLLICQQILYTGIGPAAVLLCQLSGTILIYIIESIQLCIRVIPVFRMCLTCAIFPHPITAAFMLLLSFVFSYFSFFLFYITHITCVSLEIQLIFMHFSQFLCLSQNHFFHIMYIIQFIS